jgi:hypothetical protein
VALDLCGTASSLDAHQLRTLREWTRRDPLEDDIEDDPAGS